MVGMLLAINFILFTMSGIIVSLIYAPSVSRFHHFCFYCFPGLVLLHLTLGLKFFVGGQVLKPDSVLTLNPIEGGNTAS
jgi:hypothetical protein